MTALGSARLPPEETPAARLRATRARLNAVDLRANRAMYLLCVVAAVLVLVTMIGVAYKIIFDSRTAVGHFGPRLFTHVGWVPQGNDFGIGSLIYGTLFTAIVSTFFATLLGVSIGIYLAMIAPLGVARVVGPLVEMLAAVPSVIFGLIGLITFEPFVQKIEPGIHSVLGWLPIFGAPQPVGNSMLLASLVLTFMVLPIIAALCRDVFLTVPPELTQGAEALGATRWEVIRGVILPTTRSGVVSAVVLGFGRGLGEAIAVTQVIGGQIRDPSANLYLEGDTLASRIASQFTSSVSPLNTSVLFTCAAVLLLFGLATNLLAQRIARGGGGRMTRESPLDGPAVGRFLTMLRPRRGEAVAP